MQFKESCILIGYEIFESKLKNKIFPKYVFFAKS